jgi:hypothetical protein
MANSINDLNQEKEINESILDVSNRLVASLKERFKLGAEINENERLLYGVSKQLQQTSLSLTSSIEKRNNLSVKSKDLAKEILKLETNKEKSLVLQENTASKLRQQQSDYTKQALKAFADLKTNNQKISETYAEQDGIKARLARARGAELIQLKEDLANNKSKVLQLEKQGSYLETQKNKQRDLAKSTADSIKAQKAGIKATEDEITKLNTELKLRKKIEDSLGLTGGLINLVSKIPGIGKFLKADDAKKDMEDLAIKMQKNKEDVSTFGNRTKIALAGLTTLAKGFGEALLGPEAIFTFLISAVNKADQQATALGKSLGVSKDQAYGLRENFVAYSRAVNDSFITTDRLAKAQADLSEQLGIAVQYSGEELATFSKLTEIVGLSAQEAGKLASFSAAAGMSTTDYVKQLRASSFAAQQANKVHFSDKQILQDISKLSAGILVKFQNNPKALAEAVIQVKALGLSLEQTEKIGESLLNWESSIENQLKAQLLTGKQLNLERARYLALTGSQAELSKEIASQAGSLAEFESMNVIAQKSLAEAFGMSRDELADMLMKQEAITKYGSKAAELNKEQLEYMKEHNLSADQMLDKVTNQRSVQEKFNDAMLKLQDVIGNLVAGPLGQFVSFLANGLDYVTGIAIAFGSIYAIQKGMALYQGAMVLMKGKELAVQLGIAAAWTIANPFTALAGLAIAGGVASLVASQMSAAPKFADGGIVTGKITNATVGEAGPEAIIPLNSPKANSMMGGMDLTPMINAINEVKTAVASLANRPINSTINIDGKAIGTAVGKQQETGTAQNIYTGYQMA